jgi:hypothetical protein
MIEPGEPLRHAVVISILGFESEFLRNSATQPLRPELPPNPRSVGIRCKAVLPSPIKRTRRSLFAMADFWRAKNSLQKLVIEKWRPYGHLRLLQRQEFRNGAKAPVGRRKKMWDGTG